jgi:hypothetical protein
MDKRGSRSCRNTRDHCVADIRGLRRLLDDHSHDARIELDHRRHVVADVERLKARMQERFPADSDGRIYAIAFHYGQDQWVVQQAGMPRLVV